jgi:anti-anti-sigma regulatory factor
MPLGEQVWSLLAKHFMNRVVLEWQDVAQLSMAEAEELSQLKRRVEDHDGILRLCGLSDACLTTIEQCGLAPKLAHYGSREEAVMANRPNQPR